MTMRVHQSHFTNANQLLLQANNGRECILFWFSRSSVCTILKKSQIIPFISNIKSETNFTYILLCCRSSLYFHKNYHEITSKNNSTALNPIKLHFELRFSREMLFDAVSESLTTSSMACKFNFVQNLATTIKNDLFASDRRVCVKFIRISIDNMTQ